MGSIEIIIVSAIVLLWVIPMVVIRHKPKPDVKWWHLDEKDIQRELEQK